MNPYEEMGVALDATEDQVRKAYRKKSKLAHPDAGGDRAKWDRLSTSLSVLTDPTRRKTYDDTGRIVEDKPDNDRASALQVIEVQMASIIAPFVNGTPNATDPRRLDIPEAIKGKIRMEMAQASVEIHRGQTAIGRLKDIARLGRHAGSSRHMSLKLAKPEHEVLYLELVQLVNKHAGKLSALEMLAVAANMVGKLVAMQDQRTVTPTMAMEVVAQNLEHGNKEILEQLTQSKGRA